MNLARSDVQQFLTDVSATHDPDGYKDADDAAKRFRAGVASFKAKLEAESKTGNPQAKAEADKDLAVLQEVDASFTKFYDMGKVMAKTYMDQGMEAGNAVMKGANGSAGFDAASEDLQKVLDKFHADQVEEANHITDRALGKSNAMMAVMAVSAVTAVLLAVGFGSWVVRSILRQLGSEPETAVSLAQNVGAGDLSHDVRLMPGDESSLLWQLKSMQSNLAQVVQRVRSSSDNVETTSVEIAEGNHELARRTESQANTLVQTANSMKELSQAVEQNAHSAKKANRLALAATDVASQGGMVVGQVVDTMKGINDASKKIADIISVIDGIAFQTNILALNAAVEAARAGEQGRGFAVVASEVRSLAGRSAQAAREIKSLISTSVERVEQGTTLVDQAGATMTQVVSSIKEVTEIMGRISAASMEQSRGVAEVGMAVIDMEHTTQQNAALVEEMDAAAATLREQATALVNTVKEFKLGDSHARTHSSS
ncbi:methyl-accepting chemotaxis protein [Rhodoferax aquaticus]|uniref:Methyl-accepting chemotaxis protein n=2 Tax=Rhodoferax aquaticus TaxID=2527691 RepID=A0A515EW14_9BURK|nr:methyl-accepting chemotaxis protein [Rhodoferax aquaticus]